MVSKTQPAAERSYGETASSNLDDDNDYAKFDQR